MLKLIFLLTLLLHLFHSTNTAQNPVKCDGTVIDHCIECDTDENSDSCKTCESRYFPFFNGLLCLPCNDTTYGQISCEGNCDSTNIAISRMPFCERGGCKEGYFNLAGICTLCNEESPNCLKCIYEVQENYTEGNFKCLECSSNEYRINENGRCEKCWINYCQKCHYINNTKSVCDKCYGGYYINSYGGCNSCYGTIDENNPGRTCTVCSDNNTDYNLSDCYCSYGYADDGNKNCFKCKEHCRNCLYNNKTNNTECQYCETDYTLTKDKNCIYCGEGCSQCTIDEHNNTNCISCYPGKYLYENKCYNCSEGCYYCELNESSIYKNETECLQCQYSYAFNPEKKCIDCRSVPDTGGKGCGECLYNDKKKKFDCLNCINDDYVFIDDDICLTNTNQSDLYLYGCLEAHKTGNDKYECKSCKYYFDRIDDNTCRRKDEIGISSYCEIINNLGTIENPLYSCYICKNYTVHVKKIINGTYDCIWRYNNYSYCSEGEIDENNKFKCQKCVEHAIYNSSGICNCKMDSFSKNYTWCYLCSDENEGNPGCYAPKGCNYIFSNYEFDCNQCKTEYFKYTRGQCFKCEFEINNCKKCKFDNMFKCTECLDIYSPNAETGKCEIDECLEYPEISPGCIICKDNLNGYKTNNKCQTCKYGYFKTKNETCIYCRSEKYGGPACYECGYEENENGEVTDKIICKSCYSIYNYDNFYSYDYDNYYINLHSVLSPEGKCYSCKDSLSESCLKCEFQKDIITNIETLKCTLCAPGYYLDNEGKCITYLNKINKIPGCLRYYLTFGNFNFYYYDDENNNNITFISDYYRKLYYNNFNETNEIFKNINYTIQSRCYTCKSGFIFDRNNECQNTNIKECLIENIVGKYDLIYNCENLCRQMDYPVIEIKLNDRSIDFDFVFDYNKTYITGMTRVVYILYQYSYYKNDTQNLVNNLPICYNNFSEYYLKIQFDGCATVVYIPKTNSYICSQCKVQYTMDKERYICNKLIDNYKQKFNCDVENIGTEISPLYSCKRCYYYNQQLVTFENNVTLCIEDNNLENCNEIYGNSTYLNPLYNCSSCNPNYLPYYSKYYGKQICQNVYEKSLKKKIISLEKFEGEERMTAINGSCRKNYFTPDGAYCYNCDNDNIGSPGCKGECSFSLYRNNTILCESECKEGYLETSKGICESCDSINKGCLDCSYNDTYPLDYIGFKGERRFQCNNCKNDGGYILSQEGRCLTCSDLGFDNCEKCGIDERIGVYSCFQCAKYHIFNEYGKCQRCMVTGVIINEKCINCSDVGNGGVEGCSFCEKDENDKIICKQCKDNYILFSDNNTCIKRGINKELEQFDNCLELKINNDKYFCSRCKPYLSLLKNGNEFECTYTPNLYDSYFNRYYYDHYYYKEFKQNYYDYINYRDNDYNYRQSNRFPCKVSINLGTEENPLYSCNKCYNIYDNYDYDYYIFNFDSYYSLENLPVKIIDNTRYNISYCMKYNYNTENCTEAIYVLTKGKELYNCTKCINDNLLFYNKQLDIYYCAYDRNSIKKCLVDYCKICISSSNYFCSSCITSDYEVNKYSGSCVKKTEFVPAVTWKDIYRLNMNGQKEINGQNITVPTLNLRGITSSQINNKHAFLVYLVFKIKYGLRNLEDNIRIPAICEIVKGVEESNNFVNLVDYECFGNSTLEGNYTLDSIEEEKNDLDLIKGNLNEINRIIETETENLTNKNNTAYRNLGNIVPFILENYNQLIKSSNNIFIFCLNGKMETEGQLILDNSLRLLESDNCYENIEFNMNEIDDKANCKFCLIDNINGSLTCELKPSENINSQNLTFGTYDIDLPGTNNTIHFNEIDKIVLYYDKINLLENKFENNNENNNENYNETEDTPIVIDKPKKKKNYNYNGLILGLGIGGGILVIGVLTVTLLYIFKFKKNNLSRIANTNVVTEGKTHDFNKSDTNLT